MRLLVTRPREDAEAFAAILKGRGHEAVIAPLLELRFTSGGEIPLNNVHALLASSANGIRAFASRSSQRNLPVYVVGPQTAEAAGGCGFANVISADGDAAALIAKVAETMNPADGKLLHAAGAETAGRIKQALEARGYQVETAILYEAVPVESLPENARDELRTDMLDGVLLFSPRTARTFAALVAKEDVAQNCSRLDAFCISAATATALSPLPFARLAIAGSPNQAAMLDLLPAGTPTAR
jgi:uroporphyrinogen-III synthase